MRIEVRRASTKGIHGTIIVVDSGCNQCVTPTSCCAVLHYYGTMFNFRGEFDDKLGAHVMQIVDIVMIVKFENT